MAGKAIGLFIPRHDHPALVLAGEDTDMEVRHFLTRVGAMVGEDAVAALTPRQVARAGPTNFICITDPNAPIIVAGCT